MDPVIGAHCIPKFSEVVHIIEERLMHTILKLEDWPGSQHRSIDWTRNTIMDENIVLRFKKSWFYLGVKCFHPSWR